MPLLRPLVSLIFLTLAFTCNVQASEKELQIVAFGTSFTNGKGVFRSEAWPAKLEKNLNAEGLNVHVSNQGEDGDTTLELKSRLPKAIPEGTPIVLLEYAIGNNRTAGIAFDDTVKHVEEMVSALVARNIQVLLIIRAGKPDMIERSNRRFKRVVNRYGILAITIEQPPGSLLVDGRHPTAQAHTEIAASMVAPVKELIARTKLLVK
jgi:acyl-CoA thioesterase-1